MRLAILGASGAVGAALAAQLLRAGSLGADDVLQLVGHGPGGHAARLLATRIDLQDAFSDDHVTIEQVTDIDEVEADIVVVASGATISDELPTRRDIGQANVPVFRHVTEACAARLPDALFIVVSNPVELGVRLIAETIGRRRVIGMGAQQDSLRFARAIATDLGISRHDVLAAVVGEHGQAMVPLWQSARLVAHAQPRRDLWDALDALRRRAAAEPLAQRVAALRAETAALLRDEEVDAAYRATRRALPDARVFVEPFVTFHCLHSTPNATANATLQLVAAAASHDPQPVSGQVCLAEDDGYGAAGVCGVPVRLDRYGWHPVHPDWLDEGACAAIASSTDSIRAFIDPLVAQEAAAR